MLAMAVLGLTASLLCATAGVDADDGTVTVVGHRTAPTTSATPGVGSIDVEWEAVPQATKYRYRYRQGSAAWSDIVQVTDARTVRLSGLDSEPHTVAVGSRVNNRWQNVWTEVTVTPLSDSAPPVTPPGPRPVGFADYTMATGLGIDTVDRLGHTFGKPCVDDLNGDGLADIVWSNHYDGPWDVYYGVGNGTFTEDLATDWSEGDLLTDTSPTDPNLPHKDNHGCAVADFNDDGLPDLFEAVGACIGTCTKTEGLWTQRQDGTFVNVGDEQISPSPTADRSRFPLAFDADADGDSDVFVSAVNTGSATSTNRLLFNRGGSFVEKTSGVEKGQRQVNCTINADLDRDGDQDIVVCRQFALEFFTNNGRGTFRKTSLGLPRNPVSRAVAFEDMDGDGAGDLLLVSDTKLQIRLAVGKRFPTVSYEMPLVAGRDVVTPDLNGDGRRDIYIVQTDSGLEPDAPGADIALLNLGGLDFERVDVQQSATGSGDSAQILADFWNSGRDAILVSNGWFGTVGDRQVIAAAGLTQPTMTPTRSALTLRSEPAGAVLRFDGEAVNGPISADVGSTHVVAAPVTTTVRGLRWTFDAWTDGGHTEHDIIVGPKPGELVATYQCPRPPGHAACTAD